MKTVKHITLAAAFLVLPFFSFAQDRNPESEVQNTKTTFSVEINSKTTRDELTRIEEMFKEEYNINLSFEDVKTADKKIIAFKMKLQNGKQSITKSVQNTNVPIDAFTIHIEDRGSQKYHVTIEHHETDGLTSFIQQRNPGIFDSFTDDTANTDFPDLNREMEMMIKDMETAQQKFLQLFNNVQNAPEVYKGKQTDTDKTTAAVIPGTDQ